MNIQVHVNYSTVQNKGKGEKNTAKFPYEKLDRIPRGVQLDSVRSQCGINLLHYVALLRSTSVTNQILLSEKLKVGQIERGVFQEETSARNSKNTLLIAQYH